MGSLRPKPSMKRPGRPCSAVRPSNPAVRYTGIDQKEPLPTSRRSVRLQQQRWSLASHNPETARRPLPAAVITLGKELPQEPVRKRKRKRGQNAERPIPKAQDERSQKRARTSYENRAVQASSQDACNNNAASAIQIWAEKGKWPEEYFKADSQTKRDLEQDSWFEKYWEHKSRMSHILARKRSTHSLRGRGSQSSDNDPGTTPSDQKPREVKSASYQDARYETLLATYGSFMFKSNLDVTSASKSLCRNLLEKQQIAPQDTLFRADLFDKTCIKIQTRNEAMIIQDITRLLVPSAENLAIYGDTRLDHLIESVNEGWNNCVPVTKTRPQPDYSVGFRRSTFTAEQLQRLKPFVGELTDTSYFMATYYMYFPFLTCEVKCGSTGVDIADRQNAHSMTLTVRGVVELFRLVKREKEVNREILAFSVSHDHKSVRIYGHYPVIDDENIVYYRHPIRSFDFTEQDGKEKWTTYRVIKNIYEIWVPKHLKRISSAVDQIPPDIHFNLSQQSELHFEDDPGQQLSQESQYSMSQQADTDSRSILEGDSHTSFVGSDQVTPNTSMSHRTEGTFRRPKNKRQR